jgi:general secretion pathway protein G
MPKQITHPAQRRAGFTLVEILIVVIILGILAAIVIPQFTNASASARISSLQTSLQMVRGQLALYQSQHQETLPPLANTTGWAYLTAWTSTNGSVNTTTSNATYALGPYLQRVPTNPSNSLTLVTSTATDTSAGWYYTSSGAVFTFQGRDLNGNPMTSY